MLRSLAKIAAGLEADTLANGVIERFYRNTTSEKHPFPRRFQILPYHKVSPDPHPFFEPVDPASFDQHMQFLSRYYRVMDLQELVERSKNGDVPPKAVAITFDDGYRDNFDYAFPILKKYGLPATVFVATGVIGKSDLLWHDRVFDAFRFTTRERATVRSLENTGLILDSIEARRRSLQAVLVKGKALWGDQRQRFVEDVEEALRAEVPDQGRRMLTWGEVREMHNGGILFGSHTVTHTIVSRIPRAELLRELQASKQQLAEELGAPVRTFAYPNGSAADYNDEAKALLRECGYTCAVTTRRGFNTSFADPYELKRDLPWEHEIELFRFRFFLQRHGLQK